MQPLRGITLKIASVAIFVTMQSLIKASSGHIPPGEAVFFRSVFAVPVIVVWLLQRGEIRRGWRSTNPLGHVWRALLGTTSMGLGFTGLGLLPLPEVTAIGYASPLLVVILAAMFLNERVRAFRLSTVAMGLVGVMIVLTPRFSITAGAIGVEEKLGAIVVLTSALFGALAQIVVRKLVVTESPTAIVFWFSINAALLSLVTLLWGWVWPTPAEAAMLVLAGVCGGLGQALLTSSYRMADVSVIAPFEYTSMLLAIGVGFFVFNEVPTRAMLGGAAIIIAAGVLIIWREGRLGLERTRQRKAMTPAG